MFPLNFIINDIGSACDGYNTNPSQFIVSYNARYYLDQWSTCSVS